MTEKQCVFLPEGYFEVKAIPQAEIADIYTSKELIADNELDSYYFRALEEKNIFLNEKQIPAYFKMIIIPIFFILGIVLFIKTIGFLFYIVF